jgi:hypothetical protein
MYVILHRFDNVSSWKAQTRIWDDREKASLHCDNERDRTKGEQFRYVFIDDSETWNKI